MTVALRRTPLPPLPPPLPDGDLGWVAAVLDLKVLLITKKNKSRATPQIVLAVETKEYQVIRGLSALTGTSPELQPEKSPAEWMRKGCLEHCPDKHVHVNDRDYEWRLPAVGRWTITGAGAAVILHNVMPMMRNKRDLPEAFEALMAYSVTRGQGWGATKASLMRLRNLGWRLPDSFEEALRDDGF